MPLTPNGNLTTSEKKRILNNNIFGVDIDSQAVEVTKLNLLLKALEGETNATITHQMQLFHERVLPNLSNNVKCGNTLIDHRFFDDQPELFPEQIRKVNAFDWEDEFHEIFENGGFDCVIGNPPYVDVKILPKEVKEELIRKYESADNRIDLYVPFVEKGLKITRKNGFLSYILPSMFSRRDYGKSLRKHLSQDFYIKDIVDFGTNQVFHTATNYVSIFTLENRKPQKSTSVVRFNQTGLSPKNIEYCLKYNENITKIDVDKSVFMTSDEWYLLTDDERRLFKKLKTNFRPLSNYLEFASEGIHSGKDGVFFIPKEKANEIALESPPVFPLAKGKEIHRYDSIAEESFKNVVIYPYDLETGEVLSENWLKKNAPNCFRYLSDNKKNLSGRPYFEKSSKHWYELWCQRKPNLYTEEKIIGPEIANKGEFTLSKGNLFINNKLKSLVPKKHSKLKIEYLLGILNSDLLVYYHRLIAPPKDNGYFEIKTGFLMSLPIKDIDFNNPIEKSIHDKIANNVSNILNLKKEVIKQKTHNNKLQIEKAIHHLESNINSDINMLYDILEDEIKIVEGS